MAFRYIKAYDGPAAVQKKSDPESYETKKQTTPEKASQETDRKGPEKKATGGEIAKNAVYSGLNQFNRGLASTLDFLLPTEFLGKYDVFSNLNDYYSGLADNYGSKLEESVSDRSKVVQTGAKGLESITAAAPNALLAVMTGGSSAAAQGSSAALTATSAAAGKAVAANVVQQTMRDPLFWFSAAQTLGSNYEGAKANGANELQAIGSAFASSALNAAVETGGGTETLPNALKLGGDGPATAWAKSALTEGLEEPVQSAVSGTSEKLFFDKDKPMFSLSDRSAVINPGRMAEEFAAGAAVGGILGAGQLAGSKLYTDPMELAKQGDYSGYVRELQEMIEQKRLDEFLAEYEKHVSSKGSPHRGENISFSVGRSLGAKAKNYDIVDKETGEIYSFAEGSKIQNAEVFAGAGARKPLKTEVSEGLAKEYGGNSYDWQHAKGYGQLTQDGMEMRLAEVHWFQAKGIGKVKFKIKRWMDE